jgi:hypothetical protein
MQVPANGVVDVTVICNSTLWGTMTNPVVTLWMLVYYSWSVNLVMCK